MDIKKRFEIFRLSENSIVDYDLCSGTGKSLIEFSVEKHHYGRKIVPKNLFLMKMLVLRKEIFLFQLRMFHLQIFMFFACESKLVFVSYWKVFCLIVNVF